MAVVPLEDGSNMLTEAEKAALTAQIAAAERESGGEIITVIANSSDDYRFFPILWAALIALAVPGVMLLIDVLTSNTGWTSPADAVTPADNLFGSSIYAIQVLVFLFLAVVLQWGPVRGLLVPRSIKTLRASRHARAQFIAQQVHWTSHRSGILVFVSVAEKHVDIIVDRTIGEITDDSLWQSIVAGFVSKVRDGQVAEGFSVTVDACKQVLIDNREQLAKIRARDLSAGNHSTSDHSTGDQMTDNQSANIDTHNELSNHLIEV